MSGVALRSAQLQHPESGHSVIVAFDHGGNGVVPGGEDVPGTLSVLADSAAEGILVGPGLARHAAAALGGPGRPRLVVALDLCVIDVLPGSEGPMRSHRQLIAPEEALRLGASAAKVLLPVGLDAVDGYADSARFVAAAAQQCDRLGLPLIIEPALWGPRVPGETDELIAHAARVSVELGASLLKIPAPRDLSVLRDIVAWSPVPVLLLGGAPAGSDALADDLAQWMGTGIAGLVVGRNVWSRPNPRHAVAALVAAVHHGDRAACAKHLELASIT